MLGDLGVLRSTDSARTRDYRRLYGLPADLGTAVVVRAMVYGNLDERSATGVLFTRDPSTGRPACRHRMRLRPWGLRPTAIFAVRAGRRRGQWCRHSAPAVRARGRG